MNKLKKYISQINKPLNSSNFIELLGIIFWLLLIVSAGSFFIILFENNLILTPTIEGFNNLFNIYKFPLTLLASSIVILTLRITFIKVIQTDKQLAASYRPELDVDKDNLIFYTPKEGTFINSFVFRTTESYDNHPILRIINVGFAVARNISYHFEFDLDKALKMLKEIDNENEFKFEYSSNKLIISAPKTNFRKSTQLIHKQNRKKTANFLLPTSDGKINYEVGLPLYYCELFALFLYLKLNTIKEKDILIKKEIVDSVEPDSFPKLILIISYDDLGRNPINKFFEIGFIVPHYLLPIIDGNVVKDITNTFFIEPKEII